MHDAGLKVNSPKCSFWFKDIPCVGDVINSDVIKPDPRKVQGIVDIGRPNMTTEERVYIGKFQYYRDIWPRGSFVFSPLSKVSSGLKGRILLCKYALEESFTELKCMVSTDNSLNLQDWKFLSLYILMLMVNNWVMLSYKMINPLLSS